MVLTVDRRLHVVAHDAGPTTTGGHRARVRIRQRHLLIGRRPSSRPIPLSFFICLRTVAIFSFRCSTRSSGTSDGSRSARSSSARHISTNCPHTLRIPRALPRRKSAIVLKSGASRPVSQINSTLRCASRSRRRLD